MKVFLLSSLLLLGIFVGTSFGLPVLPTGSIYDTYLHSKDNESGQRGLDVIGSDYYFQIFGHRWSEVSGSDSDNSRLEIFLSWNLDWDTKHLGAKLGDVFLDDPADGDYRPDNFIALRDHSSAYDPNVIYSQGQENIDRGKIYTAAKLFRSNDYYDISTSSYGDNEIVTGFGEVVGQINSLAWVKDENYGGGTGFNVIDIIFKDREYANWNVRFAYTCGNDVHAPVPEPATMLLLGTGLIGLAGFGRRKFKKNVS